MCLSRGLVHLRARKCPRGLAGCALAEVSAGSNLWPYVPLQRPDSFIAHAARFARHDIRVALANKTRKIGEDGAELQVRLDRRHEADAPEMTRGPLR